MGAYSRSKTDKTRKYYGDQMDEYLRRFHGLEQYDKREQVASTTDKSEDYIEIKKGGITLRKKGPKLTVTLNETIDYTEANVANLTKTIDGGLAVIAAASKFETVKTANGVSI